MLKCKTTKLAKMIDWVKYRREKRIPSGDAKAEYDKVIRTPLFDQYVPDNLGTFQRHLYRYLLHFTKEKARSDVLANKEAGVFEAYRLMLRNVFNVSEEQALDVEAQVLNPRRAKTEKDVVAAL